MTLALLAQETSSLSVSFCGEAGELEDLVEREGAVSKSLADEGEVLQRAARLGPAQTLRDGPPKWPASQMTHVAAAVPFPEAAAVEVGDEAEQL